MTNKQSELIRELRLRGMDYGKIAQRMGMKLDTVKSHCRRHGLNGDGAVLAKTPVPDAEYTSCKNCGTNIRQYPKRKRKIFCCDKCRNEWWNSHLELVEHRAYYDYVCPNCGKEFRVYGNSRRKYCCHECYIEDRFGATESL